MTAGLKPTSNGETKAQQEIINEAPAIRVFCKFEFPVYTSGADDTFDSFLRANSNSKGNPLHLIEGNLIVALVIEPSGSSRLVADHLLGDLELAAVLQVGGDAGSAEAVGADLGS